MKNMLPKIKENILNNGAKYRVADNYLNLKLYNQTIDNSIYNLINDNNITNVTIRFDGEIKVLNQLFIQLSPNLFSNKNITIYLSENMCIKKNTLLELDNLPDNVKIDIMKDQRDKTELNNWCLNLSDQDFDIVFSKIKNRFLAIRIKEQREIAKKVYLELSRKYNLNTMSSKQKMNLLFDYVGEITTYNYDLIGPDGNYKEGVDIELGNDAVLTYRNKKGVCSGRSNLLKVLANNPYMKLECYTVIGETTGGLEHEWNEFIDDDGRVYAYDRSFATKCVDLKNISHQVITRSKIVEEVLENQRPKANPNINHPTTVSSPLPLRRETSETLRTQQPPLPKELPSRNKTKKRFLSRLLSQITNKRNT